MNEPKKRKSWDEYFLDIAKVVASRSTCDRAHVGTIIVKDRVIVATGYNGAAVGDPHCDDVGHEMVAGHCVRTTHAEENALLFAGIEKAKGATLYSTHSPCKRCDKLIKTIGIARVVYSETFTNP